MPKLAVLPLPNGEFVLVLSGVDERPGTVDELHHQGQLVGAKAMMVFSFPVDVETSA